MENVSVFIIENFLKLLTAILTFAILFNEYRNRYKISILEDEIYNLNKQLHDTTSKVNPESDRKHIVEAKKSIQILGINALAPLHHCREELINFLRNKRGTLQILLVDISKEDFQKRVKKERDTVGRIKSEWKASIKIIQDISNNTKRNGKIELKLYDAVPDRSLIIIDALDQKKYRSKMLINYYSLKPGTRGYDSRQFLSQYSVLRDRDSFEKNLAHFSEIWRKSKLINI